MTPNGTGRKGARQDQQLPTQFLARLQAAGRGRGRQLRDEDELSYHEIAAVLDAEGIRPKRGER
ncbi:hypothetical protein ACFY1B_34790 [Streptomyces mirabilis]|uniref:hypothetical protein n=1 Tax=Streptomyces mirabilis TaxID=68239 RepID=UPI0036C94800